MACVIAAPSSGSGKTLLSLLLSAWARCRKLKLQPFKVGPDYLDPQLLSAAAGRPCRNLDPVLCGPDWVQRSFHGFGGSADLALVEGVMGLFDGVGVSEQGSTAAVACLLQLPVVLVVDGSGQAASLAALVKGFRDHDPRIQLAGVVLNRVSSPRHRDLLTEVLEGIGIKLLGCLPRDAQLDLPSRHLGLAPAHELADQTPRLKAWCALAEAHLDLESFRTLLRAPTAGEDPIKGILPEAQRKGAQQRPIPVAVAEDEAFHFRYPETRELLDAMGMPVVAWRPLDNEAIPSAAGGLMLPGGFPEQHASRLSQCSRSLESIRNWYGQRPIYAECGGLLLLGRSLTDLQGEPHAMAGVLPFEASKGNLQVGYRTLSSAADGLVLRQGDRLSGHEFHRWQLNRDVPGQEQPSLQALWQVDGWRTRPRAEGWGNQTIHASWVHLHWASCTTICCRWRAALETVSSPSRVTP
ncbi:MAG: cobyrinate a,c-diamide synthase [Prochlorococcus sp.]|nr:cobyrinate a,c-diamide synthase [Prochlorococcaceae cyanobacterium Fu_MAG_50]